MSSSERYEVVVGLEIHAQLSTKSKIYSSDSAQFGADPNTQVDVLTLGHPGTLPYLNIKVVDYALRMGIATKCRIRLENRFARKNYFYADLPKGYQITQDTTPICEDGYIDLKPPGKESKRIRITRIHMEEDAGKSMHDQDLRDSLIDLNRAGVPLIEIVSQPDIRSSEEAVLYLSEVRKLLRYLDICDGNMEEGSMRCDANISVRLQGSSSFGNRCEVKNLNSIRNVQRAIEHEAERQIAVLEDGGFIEQNTLNFDALSGTTSVLRSKEMSNDYRYFTEPDLPPMLLTQEWIRRVEQEMPELPAALHKKFVSSFGQSDQNAEILIEHRDIGAFFLETCQFTANYKAVFNWLLGPVKNYLNELALEMQDLDFKPQKLAEIIALIDQGKINNSLAAQQLLPAVINEPAEDALKIAQRQGILVDAGSEDLEGFIKEAMLKYPAKVLEFQQGKRGLAGLFMGEVMKLSKGKVDPKSANELLVKTLEEFKQ